MRQYPLARWGAGLAAILWWAGGAVSAPPAAAPAGPPKLEIPRNQADIGPLDNYLPQIRERIKYWVTKMRDATTVDALVAARTGLVKDFEMFDRPRELGGSPEERTDTAYHHSFAGEAANQLMPLLEAPDGIRSVRQVNVALALAQMASASLQDSLAKLAADKTNPAVRYLGWQGYRESCTAILSQRSKAKTDRLFQVMKDRAAAETSAPVVGVLLHALRLTVARPKTVDANEYRDAQKRAFAILSQEWMPRCKQVQVGDAEMAAAMVHGVESVKALAGALKDDKEIQTAALQMLINLTASACQAFCSIRKEGMEWITANVPDKDGNTVRVNVIWTYAVDTFDYIGGAGKLTRSEMSIQGLCRVPDPPQDLPREVWEPIAEASTQLMLACEEALNSLTGEKLKEDDLLLRRNLGRAEAPGQTPEAKAAWVKEVFNAAMFAWPGLLKDSGVVEPKSTLPTAPPAPTTATAPGRP